MEQDEDPIRRCFAESYRRLVGQLYGVCGDLAEAEDVVAEAFVRAVSRRRSFERVDNPEAWLRTVAVNVARTRHRRRVMGDRLLNRWEETPSALATSASDDRVAVAAALRTLPHEQREALALHYLADLPVAEVAETVGAPVGTVKARLSRGRRALAAVLRADYADLPGEVTLPSYPELVERGRRRRTTQVVVAAGSAALAVILVLGLAQVIIRGDGHAAPPPIAPSPTRGQTGVPTEVPKGGRATSGPGAAHDGYPVDLAAGSSPGSRAVVWVAGRKWKVLLTDDDFQSSTRLDVPEGSFVESIPGEDRFIVRVGWNGSDLRIVGANGRSVDVQTIGTIRPLLDSDVPVVVGTAADGLRLVGVDPKSGVAHPVNVPPELTELDAYGGKLQGLEANYEVPRFVWSTDGGTSWSSAGMADAGSSLLAVVPTAAGTPGQVIQGGDGATLFPYQGLRTINAPSDQNVTPYSGDRVTIEGQFMWRDEVRVLATRWGEHDQVIQRGVFRVVGDRLEIVGGTPALDNGSGVLSVGPSSDRPSVWIVGAGDHLYRSDDGGLSWQDVSGR